MSETPVGKTKTQGWEIGVRRTFPIAPDEAWNILMSPSGLETWLGAGVKADFKKGQTYQTQSGTKGEIRSYNAGSLIRMTWQPPEWDFASTVQLRVQPAKTGATISFHHEKMESGDQRDRMKRHWTDVMDQLGELIGKK